MVVVGSDYTDVGAPTEFSFNAKIAANLGSPVLLVLNAHDRSPEELRTAADLAVSELNANHGTLFADRRQPGQPGRRRPRRGGRSRSTGSAYRRSRCPRSRC